MVNLPLRLDGQVALVTGGSQGIGRALALGLAGAGASVAVADLPDKGDAAEEVRRTITTQGGTARAYTLDVRDAAAIRATVDRAAAELGRLDVMVNNAGVRNRRPSLEVTEADWDQTLDVNLRGVFFGAQAAARHMVPQGSGRIINVASQLGVTGMPERAAYCASKGGVVNLTRALAVEWAPYGLTINAVGPGPTDTPMVGTATAETRAMLRSRSPIGRRLAAEEIVGAVVFLASPAASGVNGHLLLVDGGWTAW